MKTRAAAIHGFAASFGIPAYSASSVPDGAEYPYLTYSVQMPSWGSGDANLQLHLWHGGSEAQANAKAEEISIPSVARTRLMMSWPILPHAPTSPTLTLDDSDVMCIGIAILKTLYNQWCGAEHGAVSHNTEVVIYKKVCIQLRR